MNFLKSSHILILCIFGIFTHPTNNLGSIIKGLLAVEGALFPGEALHNDFGLVGQCQVFPSLSVRCVTSISNVAKL